MPPKRKTASDDQPFEGITFAISGTLSVPRAAFKKTIEDNGGSVASTITKKVTHLITTSEDSTTSKVEKAKDNGVLLLSEDFVNDSVAAGKKLDEAKYSLGGSKPAKSKEDPEEEEEEEQEEPAKKKAKTAKKPQAKKATKKSKKNEEEEEEEEEEAEEQEEEEAPKSKTKKDATLDKKGRASRARKPTPKEDEEEDEEEEEEEEKPKKTTKAKAAPKTKAASKKAAKEASDDEEEQEEEEKKPEEKKMKTVIKKGRAVVDPECRRGASYHVIESGDDVYDATLNQTNIKANNNKFYIIQALEKDGGGGYAVWNRWGRVGESGQNKFFDINSKEGAIADFKKKFKEKTKNSWEDRADFIKHPGKYDLIATDYGSEEEPEAKKVEAAPKKTESAVKKESKLHSSVQDLMKLIFDLKMMENTMAELNFDVKKSPLGKLKKSQIQKGYEVLTQLENTLKSGNKNEIEALTSKFYTLIPHAFGRSAGPLIDNVEKLKQKMQMLEALGDIEIATTLLKATESDESPVDAHYASLKTDIQNVEKGSDEYKMIEKYVKNTHQGGAPKIKSIYRLAREGEADRFAEKKKLGNRMLLWHGSRLTNYVGIISQGLRIAPPEAPASGYRFGKGVYFADIMSLSSRYCRTTGKADFCMLLADVALGKTADVTKDTYMEKPLPNSHSTKALGTVEPSAKDNYNHPDGYVVPYGTIGDSGHTGVSCFEHQYIVYDVAQVELKYLLHLNM